MWSTEPIRVIGVAVAVILGLVSTLLGQGVISDALAGKVTDIVKAAEQLLLLVTPIIAAEIGRMQVTPASKE